MDIPMRTLKPRSLPLDEMWKLYKSLKNGLPEREEKHLIDEVTKLMGGITNAEFKEALRIMYGDSFYIGKAPAEFALMFIKGLKKNSFFQFAYMIKGVAK